MSEKGIKTFVSDLQPLSQQVGQHIIAALKQPGTSAVLTSIVPGFPTDRIVSVPLDDEQMFAIRQYLQEEQQSLLEPEEEDNPRTIGFQLPVETTDEVDPDTASDK